MFCLGLPLFAVVCLGLPWPALVCLGLPLSALACPGLPWSALACRNSNTTAIKACFELHLLWGGNTGVVPRDFAQLLKPSFFDGAGGSMGAKLGGFIVVETKRSSPFRACMLLDNSIYFDKNKLAGCLYS